MGNIKATQIKENVMVKVKGTVTFSYISKKIEGETLKRMNENDAQHRKQQHQKPYIKLSVRNAQIIPASPTGLNLEEQYIQEKFFTTRNEPNVLKYEYVSESCRLPRLYEALPNGNNVVDFTRVKEVAPIGEPATGLEVVMLLRTYQPKGYANKGLALDGVISQGEMKFYHGNGRAASQLMNAGITVESTLSEEELNAARQNAMNRASAPIPAAEPVEPQMGSPVVPPTGNPYANMGNSQPVTPVAPVTPVQPVAPVQPQVTPVAPIAQTPVQNTSNNWTCPECGAVASGKFCNNCGHKYEAVAQTHVAPVGNPYAQPELNTQVTGIQFDPNDNNRNY